MSISKPQLASLLLTFPLVLSSCGKKDEKTTEIGAGIRETPADLRGSWLSPCFTATMPGLPSVQREYIFNPIGDFDKLERYYTDSDCQNLGATYKSIGTVVVEKAMTEDKSILPINLTMNNAFLTVHTDVIATSFNTLKLCGRTDWKANDEQSVINVSCFGIEAKKGDVIYDVYTKKGDNLLFGDTSLFLVKDSGDKRPTTVDADSPYTKR